MRVRQETSGGAGQRRNFIDEEKAVRSIASPQMGRKSIAQPWGGLKRSIATSTSCSDHRAAVRSRVDPGERSDLGATACLHDDGPGTRFRVKGETPAARGR